MSDVAINDCGAFVYANGFKMPIEELGTLADVCEAWNSGQFCPLYSLLWSGSLEVVTASLLDIESLIENELDDECWREEHQQHDDAMDLLMAHETLKAWKEGIEA